MAPAAFAADPLARWILDADGGVVLSLRTGRIFKLNAAGAVLWETLGRAVTEVGIDELVRGLERVFAGAPEERLRQDARGFMRSMVEYGLATSRGRAGSGRMPVSEAPLITMTMSGKAEDRPPNPGFPPQSVPAAARPSLKASISAFFLLAACDIGLWTRGFPFLYRVVSRWPVRSRTRREGPSVACICCSIDRACSWYLKRALCLQRSVVGTVLLRLHGFPATLAIGAKVIPFSSHAWVEVSGMAVNDSSAVQAFYRVLARC